MKKNYSLHVRAGLWSVGIFSIIMLGSWYWYKKSDPTCGKWVFAKASTRKAETIPQAMQIFAAFLPSEPYYSHHKLPRTLSGYKEKYNLIPFETERVVLNKQGEVVKLRVFDMLLAYAIDHEGNIYAFNQCSLLR